MVQQHDTVNPAGNPIVRTSAGATPYTREEFMSDLKKVSKKKADDSSTSSS